VIVVHNPPSGDPTPSADDVAMTKLVREAGSLLEIDVLDHIVLARKGFVSLRDRHLGLPEGYHPRPNSALKVSERNGGAVRHALESGLKVVLATTRWYLLAKRTADRLGIHTPLVCNNGAMIKRPDDGSEMLHLRLDQELAREVAALADEPGWG